MGSKISKELLSKGFFPAELPACFSSSEFGQNIAKLRKRRFGEGAKWTSCDNYSMPHAKSGRRIASIVNPVPFYGLAEVIRRNWPAITKIYNNSDISFSRPYFNNNNKRAISGSDFSGYRESLITRASGYRYVLHADFARFFPTIYTHAVEWAVRGKEATKKNLRLPVQRRTDHWGATLDKHVRNMQDGQTQGLPIGPDTSYITSELICSAVDGRLSELIESKLVGSRLIDDYALFFSNRNDAEEAHSALVQAALEFQIALNDEKTYIEEIKGESKESWIYKLQDLEVPQNISQQRRWLLRFTDLAMSLNAKHNNPSIIKYSMRIILRDVVHQQNINVAIACILRLAYMAPGSMPLLADFLIGYKNVGYVFNTKPLEIYLHTVLSRALDLGHDKESIWCIWIHINLKIKISPDLKNKLSLSNCSAVLLLSRYAKDINLCGSIKQSIFSRKLSDDDFRSPNWLLAYEGAMRGWFGWKKEQINGSSLEILADLNIHFLDFNSYPPGSIKFKKNIPSGGDEANAYLKRNIPFDDLELDDLDDYLVVEEYSTEYEINPDDDDGEDEGEEEDETDSNEEGNDDILFPWENEQYPFE